MSCITTNGDIKKMKDSQATSSQIAAIMAQDMPEGRKRAFFAKLADEQKEVFCKRGRGNKWSAADAGVGCIVYLCVLFFYDVFMDL